MDTENIVAPTMEGAENKTAEVTAEAFEQALNEDDAKNTESVEDPSDKGGQPTDFEKFLEQFPEADAGKTVKRVLERGDFSEGCFTRQYVMSLRDEIAALKEENSSEDAIAQKALASGKVTEAEIKEYLKAVAANQAQIKKAPKGSAPVLPPSKPKTIAEAGVLAGDIFKNKND